MRFSNACLIVSALIVLSCSGGGDTTGPPPPPPPTTPPSPTNVRVTPGVCGSGQLTVSWTASKGATGYHVYRDTDSAPKTVTTTAWVDTGLALGSSHTYQVDAFNAVGNSSKTSVTASASGACLPTVQLSASPTSVEGGNGLTSTITIQQTNADSCIRIPEGTPVSGSFTVTPTQTSTYTVECSGPGGKTSASITITVTPAPPVPFLKIVVYGASASSTYGPVTGLSVTIKSGSWVNTTPLIVQGNMAWDSIPIPPSIQALMGSVDTITIDATDTTKRVYIPSTAVVSATSAYGTSANLSFTLTPLQWAIPSGSYVGTVIPIVLGKAMLPAFDGLCFYCLFPTLNSIPVWQNYPVSVAFSDSNLSGNATTVFHTAADSVEVFRQLAQMESHYGMDLFQPATSPDGLHFLNMIRVEFNSSLPYAGAGGSAGGGDYFFAGIIVFQSGVSTSSGAPGAFSYPGLIEHEFSHGLGEGHNCSWYTLMFTSCELLGIFNRNSPIATPGDVAYFQVANQARRVQIAENTQFGLTESLRGENLLLGTVATYSAPRPGSVSDIRVPITARSSDSRIHLIP